MVIRHVSPVVSCNKMRYQTIRKALRLSGLLTAAVLFVCALLGQAPLPAQAAHLSNDRASFPESVKGSDLILQGTSQARGPQISAPFAALSTRNGIELFARGGDVERAMASTTKMTTALVVDNAVHQGKISYQQVITVPADALIDEASIGLKENDRLTLRDLMQGALVHSGNDAATALGLTQAPTVTAFAGMMNDYVTQDLGLRHSHYINPHGLDAEGHYSCARDLVVIGSEVLRRPQLAAFVRKPQARIVINGTPQIIDSTFADALNFSSRVDGVKTGFTDEAGGCIVLAAHKDGVGLVACIMGSTLDRRQDEALALLSWGFNQLPKKTYAAAHQRFTTVPIGDRYGLSIAVAYDENAVYRSLAQGEPVLRHWVRSAHIPLSAAVKSQPVGSVAWTQGDDYLGAVTLTTVGKPFVEPARLPWQKSLY